jgi:hypothetical protein
MKTILTILLTFLFLPVFSQVNIINTTRWNLDTFSYKCAKELNIEKSFIVIQEIKGLIYGKYFAVSYGKDGSFIIGISDQLYYEDSKEVIAHELVHISQLYHNELQILDSKTIGFRGALYQVSSESHISDPQEKEAISEAKILYANNR